MDAEVVRLPRYRFAARWYDVLSLERILYRQGRMAAIELLRLRAGARVLDVGCGTGLSLGPVIDRIGDTGEVVALDASPAMLARARRRIAVHGWRNVRVVEGEAVRLSEIVDGSFDAAMFCYSLSIVPRWEDVWDQARDVVKPGGALAVVDTTYPSGWRRVFAPFIWVLLRAGGVDPRRRVWSVVQRDLASPVSRTCTGGHVVVAVGRLPGTTG